MAPKIAPKRVPPSAPSSSSSEEDEELSDKEEEHQNQEQPKEPAESEPEEEEEEGGEGEEEEEDEQVKNNNNRPSVPKPTPTSTTKNPQSHSSSDSDSDTHSGQTQHSPTASDFTIKPIASKPMNGSPKSKKPTSKPIAKRPLEFEKNANESNKKKTKVEEEEKKSGGAVNRLWSEDNEVVVLKGMIEFQSKKGIDPYSDTSEFHESIKKLLSVEVSKNQLMDKVRRLKKKYENNAEKGEDLVFLKPHEHKCFGLSKKIWGSGGGNESNGVDGNGNGNGKSGSKRARKNVKFDDSLDLPKESEKGVVLEEGLKGGMKDVKADKVEDFWSMHPYLKQSQAMKMETPFDLSMKEPVKSFMMRNMSVIGNVKAKELEKKWKNLCLDEAALYLRRVELIKEQTKLALDAMKASKD